MMSWWIISVQIFWGAFSCIFFYDCISNHHFTERAKRKQKTIWVAAQSSAVFQTTTWYLLNHRNAISFLKVCMILKSEESVPVSLPALVLSADHVLLSSTATIKEGSAFLTALNSSLSEYNASSARTAAEHMHFFLISGCPVLQFLFHLFLLLLLFLIISSLLSRIPSILWRTDFYIHLSNGSERFHRMLILSCAFFISTNMMETLFSWIHHLSTNTTCHCERVKSTFYK